MPPTVLSEIAGRLRAAQRIALVTHLDPDADAIGSTLGLALALQALGKQVVALCDDAVPAELRFLPGAHLFVDRLPPDFAPDLLVALDSSDTERLGKAATLLLEAGLPVINVDHHATNLRFGVLNLVETECAATAELILHLIEALGTALTPDVATCLMAGLVGDTRSFSTAQVTPATLRAAAQLAEAGADLFAITERVLNTTSVEALRQLGLALSTLRFEGGVVWTTIPYDAKHPNNPDSSPRRGIASLLLQAREAAISAVFTEQADGRVEVSMRARPGYNVAELALALGGGGHPLAAGCTLEAPLEEAVRRVVEALKDQVAARGGTQNG